MAALDQGAEMVHVLKTGSKATKARARKTGAPKGRKSAKTKRGIASSITRRQAPSVADLQAQLERRTTELDRALERQTATADILRVIASSPSDVQPVFEAIAESAARLCQAEFCNVFRFDGELIHFMHSYGYSREAIEALRHFYPMRPGRGSCAGRAILNGKVEQVPDVRADPEYAQGNVPDIMKISSIVAVPMVKERRPVGAIALVRAAKGTFPQRQIDLLKTFADQAVIAIENTRLFEEVRTKTRDLEEALVYQTGSSNILKVIASSPTDVGPALKAIVESACEICGAYDAVVFLKDGGDLVFSAHHGPIPIRMERWPINRKWFTGRAVADKAPQHIHDVHGPEGDDFPEGRELGRHQGHRTVLSVPLLREGEAIGAISLRRIEVHPFSDKQVALLESFADQAVIAIENVRLFDEVQAKTRDLQESLQQQTATAEVLQIISSSPGELEPVFQAMLENATRVCGAKFGIMNLYDGDSFESVALFNVPPAYAELRKNSGSGPIRWAVSAPSSGPSRSRTLVTTGRIQPIATATRL
jgi:GAF domain-containing protein